MLTCGGTGLCASGEKERESSSAELLLKQNGSLGMTQHPVIDDRPGEESLSCLCSPYIRPVLSSPRPY